MLRLFEISKSNEEVINIIKNREEENLDLVDTVSKILKDVKDNKDKALRKYTEAFDKVKVKDLRVSENEIKKAFKSVEEDFIEDLKRAAENIEKFHEKQKSKDYIISEEDGTYMGQRVLPLERVGVYVPGGTAAYPSSVLMNVIPAKVAGVKEIVMVTPPSKAGGINPYIAVAAKIAGVKEIYKVGGAQAIAALAYGTESIERVDKIVGPGNTYVATAKKLVFGKVDIDMIAGPSEILIIADDKADAKYVAADLMSQAEHDKLAASILLTTSVEKYKEVVKELKKQVEELERKAIIKEAFKNYGMAIICPNLEKCIELSNIIAPEHLELMVENPMELLGKVKNAGSVFLGYYSPEPVGDYFGGPNHVLPTSGTARFFSALSVDSFVKKSSFIYYSKEAINREADKIILLAEKEGLTAHANSVKVRVIKEWRR